MNKSKPVRAIARGLEVIDVLNAQRSTSVRDLGERTNMPRATLLRILRTLEDAGWVYRYRTSGCYRLTSEVCSLGQHVLTIDRLAETAAPVLDQLHEDFDCATEIAIFAGHEMRILDSRHAHTRKSRTRASSPSASILCSALGRAYLAFCSKKETTEILETLSRAPACREQIDCDGWLATVTDEIRAVGYALTGPGQCERHRRCEANDPAVAVPVRPNAYVRGCLGVSWNSEFGIRVEDVLAVVPTLMFGAQRIADELRRMESA